MDLQLTAEHKMIQDMARDFAQKEIAPIAAQIDEAATFPTATVKKMGELGFMGIEIAEEYGGTGLDTLSYVLAMIEISKACASHGVIMSVNNSLVCHGLSLFGTEQQKQDNCIYSIPHDLLRTLGKRIINIFFWYFYMNLNLVYESIGKSASCHIRCLR